MGQPKFTPIPASFTSGEQDLYAFFGSEFGNIDHVQEDFRRARKILQKSKACGEMRKRVLQNKLNFSSSVLLDELNRTWYNISCMEKTLLVPMPNLEISYLSYSDLLSQRDHLQVSLNNIKDSIKQLQKEQQTLKEGLIPDGYDHITVKGGEQYLQYEVPKTNIDVEALRNKDRILKARRRCLEAAIVGEQKAVLKEKFQKAVELTTYIHGINHEIADTYEAIL